MATGQVQMPRATQISIRLLGIVSLAIMLPLAAFAQNTSDRSLYQRLGGYDVLASEQLHADVVAQRVAAASTPARAPGNLPWTCSASFPAAPVPTSDAP